MSIAAIVIMALVAWITTKALDGQERVSKCGSQGAFFIVAAAVFVTAAVLCLVGAAIGGGAE